MTNEVDRRVRKTQKVLRLGLAQLLSKKSIQEVTVRELTEKVDIHRSTFYNNFEDIYALYKHMEDVTVAEISEIISTCTIANAKDFFEALLKYIVENKEVSVLFFSGKVNRSFTDRITNLFIDSYLEDILTDDEFHVIDDTLKYYEFFCLSGSLAVIGKWITGEFQCSTTELVSMLMRIDEKFQELARDAFPKLKKQ